MARRLVMNAVFPVFILSKDSGDIEAFHSMRELSKSLEAIDVENKEYEAWDSRGFRLMLSVTKPTWLRLDVEGPDLESLMRAVQDHAKSHCLGLDLDTSDPKCVVRALIQYTETVSRRRSFFDRIARLFRDS